MNGSVLWMHLEGEVSRIAGDGFFWRVRHFGSAAGAAIPAIWEEISVLADELARSLPSCPESVRVACARTLARHVAEGYVVMYARALDSYAVPALERAWAASCGKPEPGAVIVASQDFGTCARRVARQIVIWSSTWGMNRLTSHHGVDVAMRLAAKETRDARIPRDIHIMRLATSQLGREGFSWFDEGFKELERGCAHVLESEAGLRRLCRSAHVMSEACREGWSGEAMLAGLGTTVGEVLGVRPIEVQIATKVPLAEVAQPRREQVQPQRQAASKAKPVQRKPAPKDGAVGKVWRMFGVRRA